MYWYISRAPARGTAEICQPVRLLSSIRASARPQHLVPTLLAYGANRLCRTPHGTKTAGPPSEDVDGKRCRPLYSSCRLSRRQVIMERESRFVQYPMAANVFSSEHEVQAYFLHVLQAIPAARVLFSVSRSREEIQRQPRPWCIPTSATICICWCPRTNIQRTPTFPSSKKQTLGVAEACPPVAASCAPGPERPRPRLQQLPRRQHGQRRSA